MNPTILKRNSKLKNKSNKITYWFFKTYIYIKKQNEKNNPKKSNKFSKNNQT